MLLLSLLETVSDTRQQLTDGLMTAHGPIAFVCRKRKQHSQQLRRLIYVLHDCENRRSTVSHSEIGGKKSKDGVIKRLTLSSGRVILISVITEVVEMACVVPLVRPVFKTCATGELDCRDWTISNLLPSRSPTLLSRLAFDDTFSSS